MVNPEGPRKGPETKTGVNDSLLDLLEKERNNELTAEEKEELKKRRDRIFDYFFYIDYHFGTPGFLKTYDWFEGGTLSRVEYDRDLKKLSEELQKTLKIPRLTGQDLKEKIFDKFEEAVEIKRIGKKISSSNEEDVKKELMEYLENRIKVILKEKGKRGEGKGTGTRRKKQEGGVTPEGRPAAPEEGAGQRKQEQQKEGTGELTKPKPEEINFRYFTVSRADALGGKLREAEGEKLEKLRKAIQEHNERVRKKAAEIEEKTGKRPEIFRYELAEKGETEKQAKEREEHNKKEFEKFLEYCRNKPLEELRERGWTGGDPQKEENREEFLKFVRERWQKMWERAVEDVENIEKGAEQEQSRKDQERKSEEKPVSKGGGGEQGVPEGGVEKTWFGPTKESIQKIIVTGLGGLGGIGGGLLISRLALWGGLGSILGTVGLGIFGGLITWGIYELWKRWKEQGPETPASTGQGQGGGTEQRPETPASTGQRTTQVPPGVGENSQFQKQEENSETGENPWSPAPGSEPGENPWSLESQKKAQTPTPEAQTPTPPASQENVEGTGGGPETPVTPKEENVKGKKTGTGKRRRNRGKGTGGGPGTPAS